MESRQLADVVRGGILLATAILLGVLLWKFYQVAPRMGISIKQAYYFPIALVAGICWVTYRGVKTIVTALRRTD